MKAVGWWKCSVISSVWNEFSNAELLQHEQTEDEDEVGADMDATRIALADEFMTESEEYN